MRRLPPESARLFDRLTVDERSFRLMTPRNGYWELSNIGKAEAIGHGTFNSSRIIPLLRSLKNARDVAHIIDGKTDGTNVESAAKQG